MGLTNAVSDFFNKDPARKDKDNTLIVSIFLITKQRGWMDTAHDFGVDDHWATYSKIGGLKLRTSGSRKGGNFDLTFAGEGPGTLPGSDGKAKEKMVLDMDMFVTDKQEIINEELLRTKVNSILETIERRVG